MNIQWRLWPGARRQKQTNVARDVGKARGVPGRVRGPAYIVHGGAACSYDELYNAPHDKLYNMC